MNSPRISMLFWGILEIAVGLGLILVPAQLTGLIGIDEPMEVWIRAGGVPLAGLGVYYLYGAMRDDRSFYRTTVPTRFMMAAGAAYLAVVDGPWQLWIFALGCAMGASWTFVALRNSARTSADSLEAAAPGTAEPQEI